MTAYTETVEGQTTGVSRAFDAANRLQTSVDATAGTTSYIYDDNGNLTEVYPPGSDGQNPVGVLRYDYDQRNLMVNHEVNPDGTAWVVQAAYVYDGANDRLQQVNYTSGTPVTTTYSNDVAGLTQVLVADDGTEQVHNLFGLDLISQDSGSEVRTLLVDGLGSVRVEMVAGVVETATTYEPYGEVLQQTGTSGTVYGFTGGSRRMGRRGCCTCGRGITVLILTTSTRGIHSLDLSNVQYRRTTIIMQMGILSSIQILQDM